MEQLELRQEILDLYVTPDLAKELDKFYTLLYQMETTNLFDVMEFLESIGVEQEDCILFKEGNLFILNYSRDADNEFIDIEIKKTKLVDAFAQLFIDLSELKDSRIV